MPTRRIFDDDCESTVPESEDDVALAVRRDRRDHVRLGEAAAAT